MSRVNFITVSSHRSGSSVFQRYLDQHNKVIARQEDLRTDHLHGKNIDPKRLDKFLDEIFTSNKHHAAVGFKVQYSHGTDHLKKYIKRNNIKVFHLIRNNILDTVFWYPGNYIGEVSGGFGPPLVLESDTVEGKIPKIIDNIKWINERIKEWKEFTDLEVTYNDMTNNKAATTFHNKDKRKEIWSLLELDDSDFKLPQSKAGRPSLQECCVNYEEIIQELDKQKIEYAYR